MRTVALFLWLCALTAFAQWRHHDISANGSLNANQPDFNCRPYLLGKPDPQIKMQIVQTVIPLHQGTAHPFIEYFDGINLQPIRPDMTTGDGLKLLDLLKRCYLGLDYNNADEMGKWFLAHPVGDRRIMGICHRVGSFQPFIFTLQPNGAVTDFKEKLLRANVDNGGNFWEIINFDARDVLFDNSDPNKPAFYKVALCMRLEFDGNDFSVVHLYGSGFCSSENPYRQTSHCYQERCYPDQNNLISVGNRDTTAKHLWFSGDHLVKVEPHAYRADFHIDHAVGQRFLVRNRKQDKYEECFFLPAKPDEMQVDLRINVIGNRQAIFVREGPAQFEPIDPPQTHTGGTPCQSTILPSGGEFRIYAYEGKIEPAHDYRAPQIAVYSGDKPMPLYRGDPAGLSSKCSMEDNSEDTAAAHFGLRALSMDTVVAFCQHAYGPQPKNKAYVFVLKYSLSNGDGILMVKNEKDIQMPADSPTGSKFLDARGVIHIPKATDALFVQVQPCYVWTVVDSTVNVKKVGAAKCVEADLGDLAAFADPNKFNASSLIEKCDLKSCYVREGELMVGDPYDPKIYRSEEMFKQKSKGPVLFADKCVESHEEMTTYNGQPLRTFRFVDSTFNGDDPNTPCLALNNWAHHAHLLYNKNAFSEKLCTKAGFLVGSGTQNVGVQQTTPSPAVSRRVITLPPTTVPTLLGTAHCTTIWIATTQAVIIAGSIAAVFFVFLIGLVVAGCIGRRNYLTHKDEKDRDKGTSYTSDGSKSIMTTPSQLSVIPQPTPAATPVVAAAPTPSAENLFDKIGDFTPKGK